MEKKVGIADLKARLRAHLRDVREGQTLVVFRAHQPIARIVPIDAEVVERDGGSTSRRR